jgi:hypothetical protein
MTAAAVSHSRLRTSSSTPNRARREKLQFLWDGPWQRIRRHGEGEHLEIPAPAGPELAVTTRRPFHSNVLRPGKSVVSVRNGLSSTRPSSTVERRRLIGLSGFVISVEVENEGSTRSTRLLMGAQPSPS